MKLASVFLPLVILAPVVARAAAPGVPVVGAPAPPAGADSWLQGRPLNAWAPGRVYVVDIWAPWCGPCVGGMPHLTELQKKNESRGLTVVGLTGPDEYGSTLASARKLVAEKTAGIGYAVGWKEDLYRTWMAIEKDQGWPWTFIVDRKGRIAWTGHPSKLDPVLEQVLAGTWDEASAEKRYARRHEALDAASRYYAYCKEQRWQEASALYASIGARDPEVAAGWAIQQYKILAFRLKRTKEAADFGNRAVSGPLRDDTGNLARLASLIVDPAIDLSPRDLPLAQRAAERADEISRGSDPGVAATLAQVYFAQGDRRRAVEAQKRAIDRAPADSREEFRKALARYEKEETR